MRVLIPVAVYPPGNAGATPPPKDYLALLLGQTDQGDQFTDETKTTIGGRPATIVTATSDKPLDGSIGCPEASMTAPGVTATGVWRHGNRTWVKQVEHPDRRDRSSSTVGSFGTVGGPPNWPTMRA